jgi:hypothetical protein
MGDDNSHDRAEGTKKFVIQTTSNKFDAGRLAAKNPDFTQHGMTSLGGLAWGFTWLKHFEPLMRSASNKGR